MGSPETAGSTARSLAQDWLYALRYWLRGPKGIAALLLSALALGAALNWSWLVAIGVAPLLIAALPCAAMCALGLCMNRMIGGSCSGEAHPVWRQTPTRGSGRLSKPRADPALPRSRRL
jgi:hypothetical protein